MREPARVVRRPIGMRRALGTLLAAAALTATAGCGSATSSTAADQRSTPTPSDGPITGAQVTLVSQTGGGGRVSTAATPLDTRAQVAAFSRQFRGPMAHQISQAVTAAGKQGQLVFGAVIAVGCDRPPGADVTLVGGHVQIVPQPVASPLPECLAAVTTVAVASVPGED